MAHARRRRRGAPLAGPRQSADADRQGVRDRYRRRGRLARRAGAWRHGLHRGDGRGSLYRDARIAPIYEGTNGIQAIDLVTRKLPLAAASMCMGYHRRTWPNDRRGPHLQPRWVRPAADALDKAHRRPARSDAISCRTRWPTAMADQALAGATPYLRLFALTAGGAYLAKAAPLGRGATEPHRALPLLRGKPARRNGGTARRRSSAAPRALLAAGAVAGRLTLKREHRMTDHIIVERRGAVQIIRMNRPDKKNALTRAMYATMSAALDRRRCRSGRSASMSSSACPARFRRATTSPTSWPWPWAASRPARSGDFLLALGRSQKPIVSGVDGIAVGIGTTLNLHCDLTFATRAHRVPHAFRRSRAWCRRRAQACSCRGSSAASRRFALLGLGEGFSADRAKTAGLIYEVVDEDELEARRLRCRRRDRGQAAARR